MFANIFLSISVSWLYSTNFSEWTSRPECFPEIQTTTIMHTLLYNQKNVGIHAEKLKSQDCPIGSLALIIE